MNLPFSVSRTLVIRAQPQTVFSFFRDSERFASWWGKGSHIELKPGGAVHIVYPGGVTAGGAIVSFEPDRSIIFTYGYDDPAKPIARGASLVSITLTAHDEGTLLTLRHDVATAPVANQHVAGWRFQLSVFANVAAATQHADAARVIDQFFVAWNKDDDDERAYLLKTLTTDNVAFRDSFAAITGRNELAQHIGAVHMHMPGLQIARNGDARHCQGTILVNWTAGDRGGTNVFRLAGDGRIADVVGFWNA